MVHNGSFVNLMSWHTFQAIGIPKDKLVTQTMPLVTFSTSSHVTKGFVNVDLQVESLRASTKFYVVDMEVSYYVLLGRRWIQHNQVLISTLH